MCIFSLYFNQRVPASKACDSYYLLARPFEITTISMISSCIYIHVRLLGYLQMHSILMTSEFILHNWNNVAFYVTLQTLLPVANILQITEVRDACCDFLQSQLHPSNCIGIRAFADLHACTELLNYAQTYTEQHFV